MSGSASSAIRIARARPMAAATVADVPPSGISPMRAKASRKLADSAATTRSAARAVEQPTPAATPLTAATTGLGQPVTARTIRLAASRARTSNRSCASSPEMSAPALNAGPVPVRTTTRTSSFERGVLEPLGQGDGQLAAERVEHGGPVEGEPECAAVARLDQEVVSLQQRSRPPRASRPARPAWSRAPPRHRGRAARWSRTPPAAASRAVARTQWSVAIPQMSTCVTSWARSHSASGCPSWAPSKPEYAAWCSPLRKIASKGCGSRLGWNASPSVPTRQCTGQESTKSGSLAQWSPGSMWWSLVATTRSYAEASGSPAVRWCSSRPTSAATWAPPVTGSDPPSQKSFCTSTTMSAVFTRST